MRISVITPSLNAGKYIDRTIQSVVSQRYADVELIIVDGGSDDNTLEIAKEYGAQITEVIFRPGLGQYEAINLGMEHATGEIVAWLNADDIYMPWTFSVISEIFRNYSDICWLTGQPAFINDRDQLVSIYGKQAAYPRDFIRNGWYRSELAGYLQQESMFWRRSLWDKVGGLDTKWKLAADFALWVSFAEHESLVSVSVPLAAFRRRPGEQLSSRRATDYAKEVQEIATLLKRPPKLWRWAAKAGVIARSLCRLAIGRVAETIVYSTTQRKWIRVFARKSLSRVGIGALALERRARRGR